MYGSNHLKIWRFLPPGTVSPEIPNRLFVIYHYNGSWSLFKQHLAIWVQRVKSCLSGLTTGSMLQSSYLSWKSHFGMFTIVGVRVNQAQIGFEPGGCYTWQRLQSDTYTVRSGPFWVKKAQTEFWCVQKWKVDHSRRKGHGLIQKWKCTIQESEVFPPPVSQGRVYIMIIEDKKVTQLHVRKAPL